MSKLLGTMKNSITIISIIALLLSLSQCKKNTVETTNNGNNNPTVQADNSSVAKLLKFKKQVEYYKANPNVKDGETMTVDEAVWNLENLFNITYTFPEYSYSELVTQEFELNINSENGQILSSDVAALYEELKNESRTLYANDGFTEDKGFLTLHAEIVNTRGGEVVKVKITTGEKTNYNLQKPHVLGPFSSGNDTTLADNWQYADGMGNCDDSSIDSGADKQLQEKLEMYRDSLESKPNDGYRLSFIDPIDITIIGNGRNCMFYSEKINETCINWYEMNDYLYGYTRLIFNHYLDSLVACHGDNIHIESITINGMQNKNRCIRHDCHLVFGNMVELNLSDFGEASDLLE